VIIRISLIVVFKTHVHVEVATMHFSCYCMAMCIINSFRIYFILFKNINQNVQISFIEHYL